jgi:hypothetical protein
MLSILMCGSPFSLSAGPDRFATINVNLEWERAQSTWCCCVGELYVEAAFGNWLRSSTRRQPFLVAFPTAK